MARLEPHQSVRVNTEMSEHQEEGMGQKEGAHQNAEEKQPDLDQELLKDNELVPEDADDIPEIVQADEEQAIKELAKERKSVNRVSEEQKRKSLLRDSIQRKTWIQSLAATILNRNGDKKPHGVLDWFHILRAISDEDLRSICGGDAALYLLFVRYAGLFFFGMTLFNCAILIPIYATGEPSDPNLLIDKDISGDQVISLLVITVLNVTGTPAKMITVYILILGFYTAGTLLLMFFYWKRSLSW